jgi:hypothetical protein
MGYSIVGLYTLSDPLTDRFNDNMSDRNGVGEIPCIPVVLPARGQRGSIRRRPVGEVPDETRLHTPVADGGKDRI